MRFEKEVNIYGDEIVLKRFKAAETSIAVVQGNISAIISESELVELVNSKATMYSKLASAVMDIKSLTINFSDLTTKYNAVSGQYTALDSKVAQYKLSVDGLSADIAAVQQDLNKNYSTTTEMNAAIKANVEDVPEAMTRVLLLDMQPKTYYLRKEYGTRRIGFIAQDVQAVLQRNGLDTTLFVKNITNPETGEQFLGLDYIDMIAVLWKGIQMLDLEIQKLKACR